MSTIRIARRLTPAAAALAAFALAAPISAVRGDDNAPAAGHATSAHDHSQMHGASGREQGPMAAMSGQGHDHAQGMSPEHHEKMMQRMMGGRDHGQGTHGTPTLPGQDAFGAIQEVVRILEADPKTDWSKVDLEALRQHLIDMNEVTLKADAAMKPVEGGLEIAVTGAGRTFAAIQRMLPAHAQELDGMNGWSAVTETLPNGVRLTVTSSDAKEAAHIRGLGFIGLLASGSHHQPHHLAMAKSESPHRH
jgi:hypothetical protein